MKKLILILLLGFVAGLALKIDVVPKEKEDEVLISGPVDKGKYGGLVIKFTELNDNFAMLMGGKAGITFARWFGIGGGLYGMVNKMEVHTNYPMRDFNLDFLYGGLILELILASRKLIHCGAHTLIGCGTVQYKFPLYEEPWYDDIFFVFEPCAEMTLNVTKVFRIDIGGSYRYVYGTELNGISDSGLSGAGGYITFKFGKF